VATYDVLGRVKVNDGTSQEKSYQHESTETSYTERTAFIYTIPASQTDLAIDLLGISSASVFMLRNNTTTSITYRLNGVGNTQYTLASGVVLIVGGAITSLHVTTTDAVTIELVGLS